MKKLGLLIVIVALALGSYFSLRSRDIKQVIVQQPLVKTKTAQIKTLRIKRGKYHIYAKAYLPVVNKRLPIVVIAPGYTASYRDYEIVAQKLYKEGIIAVVFDFVGGNNKSASGGKMINMSPSSEESDLNAVINYFMKQGYVNQKAFYLAGHSQGGLISALVAAKRSDICSLFLCAPAFNIPEMCKFVAIPKKGSSIKVGNGEVGHDYVKEMKAMKMYKDVKSYANPVYIFHGTIDLTVPISYSWDAKDAYRHCTVYPYADEGHIFSVEALTKMCQKVVSIIANKKTKSA